VRSSALVINFFPGFTPQSSGGEMRLVNLYRAVSQYIDVTMLTSTDFGARFEQIVHTPTFRELRFPKDEVWAAAYATLERSGVTGELSGLAFALAVSDPACRITARARDLARSADYVIHEFPYSEPIFSDGCAAAEIYNSHNFESSLLPSVLRGAGLEAAWIKLMRLEANLVARAQRTFATSNSDAEKFRLFFGAESSRLGLCPNGFDERELAPVVAARAARTGRTSGQKLLFLGSAHAPNVEAAAFLVQIAPQLPDCRLLLAGALCASLPVTGLPANVELLGAVDPAQRLQLLADVDVFVNPVVLGSGTSLKALEALGAGVPMVSTPEGARGLELRAGVHCEIADRAGFVAAIQALLADQERRNRQVSAGLDWVRQRFSWDRIASHFIEQLRPSDDAAAADAVDPAGAPDAPLAAAADAAVAARPLLLAFNDYAVKQRGSGGIARVRNLLSNLDCDVVLITFDRSFDIALIGEGFLHVTVAKTDAHVAFEEAVNAGESVSVNDGVASLFAASHRALTQIACALALRARGVVFEHPYMAPVLDALSTVRSEMTVIYSAHNVESKLKAELLGRHRLRDTWVSYIAELEGSLLARADWVVCCTKEDADLFKACGAEVMVVPNGCELVDKDVLDAMRQAKRRAATTVGFLGSSHGPNVDAAEYILKNLAPEFPEVQMEIIGSVCTAVRSPIPRNVVLHGLVDEVAKTSIMSTWDIGLNPLMSGGGSSLKLPDYMAHGLATLSTPAGARGFDIDAHDAGAVVALDRFSHSLSGMLREPDVIARQRAGAHQYAWGKLGWRAVTSEYRRRLHAAMTAGAPQRAARKLLIVTYRYTEPPLGGAEEYLIEIVKRLRPRFDSIDLAAIDVGHLTNKYHFGCLLGDSPGGASRRLAESFDQARYFAADEVPNETLIAGARNIERGWMREERALLSRFATKFAASGRLRFFGGVYGPESHDGVTRRWTSPQFSLLLPRRARSIHMKGFSGVAKKMVLTLGELVDGETQVITRHEQFIDLYLDLSLSLPTQTTERVRTLVVETEEHNAAGDHRPLGVLLESAYVLTCADDADAQAAPAMRPLLSRAADFKEQYEEELRSDDFDAWVGALLDMARSRDPQMDQAFAAVRGPHSGALQSWLAKNAGRYDGVLVQGIPFDLIPSTVETLSALPHRPRIVTLPHFHGDDRFYHWKRYYESLAAADVTLLFSSSIAAHFAGHCVTALVPGGGVRSEEHGDTLAPRRFKEVHRSDRPFFLVLGRKTPSKGYEEILAAHRALRRFGSDAEVLLIGPDEDGVRIDAPGVYYLGRQPREVIRGALSGCLALVTMSRTESFGIAVCEAWLFGKPVIANKACYSFRELIEDGTTGFLVDSQADLVWAMRHVEVRADERRRMGEAGFSQVTAKFSWEGVADACAAALMGISK